MVDNVQNSTAHIPTTVHSDDHQVSVTAQHHTAATGGEAVTRVLDQTVNVAEAAAQVGQDTYEAGKVKVAQGKERAKTVANDVSEVAAEKLDTVKVKTGEAVKSAQQTVGQAAQTTKVGLQKTAAKGVELGGQSYDAAASAVRRANDTVRTGFQRIGDGWRRSIEAGAGERPITFLGLNSVPLATAGAILGLGLGLAGLFTAITVYVPLSAILIGAGVISLLDLALSLAYRSSVKANDPTAHPLTALAQSGRPALTPEERYAHIVSECELLEKDKQEELNKVKADVTEAEENVAHTKAEYAAMAERFSQAEAQRDAALAKQNDYVADISGQIRPARENLEATMQGLKQQKENLVEIHGTHAASVDESARLIAQQQSKIQQFAAEKKVVSDNIAKVESLHASLLHAETETQTHQSGSTVKLSTSSKDKGKGKGKHREVSTSV